MSTGEVATDVRTVLSWSRQQLSSQANRAFRLLGLHPGPDISLPAAASLAGLPADETRRAMAELVRAHLVTEHVPGRFACYDLLRAYAAEQTGSLPEAQRHAATGRMFDHYLHAAVDASRLIYPDPEPIPLHPPRAGTRPERFADRQEALEWFRAECQVLLAVIGQAAAGAEFSSYAWQLPWAVAFFLDGAGCWQELAMVQESALAAASGDGNRAAQAAAHFHLSTAQIRVGAFAEATAHLAAMLELGQELGDDLLQAQAHGLLSKIFERQGRTHDALGSAEHALRLYRAAGDRAREACALNTVGWQYARLGRYQETLSFCGRALKMHREQGTRVGEAGALDSLGYAHHHLGDHDQAIVRFQQAIEILDDDADIHFRSEILTHLGDASHAAGNPAAARQAWEEALAILDDLQHADAEQVRSRLAAPQLRPCRNPGVRD